MQIQRMFASAKAGREARERMRASLSTEKGKASRTASAQDLLEKVDALIAESRAAWDDAKEAVKRWEKFDRTVSVPLVKPVTERKEFAGWPAIAAAVRGWEDEEEEDLEAGTRGASEQDSVGGSREGKWDSFKRDGSFTSSSSTTAKKKLMAMLPGSEKRCSRLVM